MTLACNLSLQNAKKIHNLHQKLNYEKRNITADDIWFVSMWWIIYTREHVHCPCIDPNISTKTCPVIVCEHFTYFTLKSVSKCFNISCVNFPCVWGEKTQKCVKVFTKLLTCAPRLPYAMFKSMRTQKKIGHKILLVNLPRPHPLDTCNQEHVHHALYL